MPSVVAVPAISRRESRRWYNAFPTHHPVQNALPAVVCLLRCPQVDSLSWQTTLGRG
jgi:hypothetical protein